MSANITLLINAENRASQVLSKVQSDVSKAQESIVKSNQQVIESTKRLNTNILSAASSFASLGAGVTALYTSFSNLDKAELRVAVAQKEVTSAQATALQAQLAYQKALERFGESSEQAQQALLRLKASQEQLRIAEERARLAQNDLSDAYLNFAANLAPQVIALTIGMQGAFKALGITSLTQLVPSIRAVGVALKSAFITNPVGIAIIGISTAVALLATNTFGLRDRIIELGNTILGFIDKHLKPLADAIRLILDAIKPINDFFGSIFTPNIANTSNAIDDLKRISIQSFDDIEESMNSLSTSTSHTFASIEDSSKEFSNILKQSLSEVEESIKSSSISIRDDLSNGIDMFNMIGDTAIDASLKMDTLSNVTKFTMKEISNSIKENASIILDNNKKIISSIEETVVALTKGSIASKNIARKSGVIELPNGFITPAGTIVEGRLSNTTMVLKREIVEGIRSGKITRVTAEDYIAAAHGFEGIVTKPTLFLAGESGAEYVRINPSSNNLFRLVVEFVTDDGRSLGSETLDLVNKEAKLRLKAKGARLF